MKNSYLGVVSVMLLLFLTGASITQMYWIRDMKCGRAEVPEVEYLERERLFMLKMEEHVALADLIHFENYEAAYHYSMANALFWYDSASDQTKLRMPPGLKERVEAFAKEGRYGYEDEDVANP